MPLISYIILGGVVKLKLFDILKKYPIVNVMGPTDIDINGVEHDSRKITNNNLFIAHKGFTHDGHDFIEEAIDNGAIAILAEKEVDLYKDVTIIKVRDSLDALGYVAGNFHELPWKKMKTIGITGTNGKTSVSYYLKNILEKDESKVGILGTIGAIMDNSNIDLVNTTPDALEIQKILSEMVKRNVEYSIMEVSSHALDLKRVKYMDFDIGVFTNLSEEHLDYHGTMENYLGSKIKLFYKTKKYNIINIDDPYGKIIVESIGKKIPLITFGLKETATIYATDIKYELKGSKFTLNTPKGNRNIELNIPGEFSVYNALAAASCSYAFDMELGIIKEGLESFKGVKGRFELVSNPKNLNIIIDFAHTPKGLEAVLKAIRKFTVGKLFVVFGAGGDRDRSKRPVMGKIVGKYADLAIVTSDNPRSENPDRIIRDIVVGLKEIDGKYVEILDRKDAIKYAILKSGPNDTILLAGKGHENNMIIGKEVLPFDEREIVLNIMNEV